jgi:hypothetical protein
MTTLLILLVMVALLAGAFGISRILMKKALRDMVSLFRKLGAVNAKSAATLETLGLVPGHVFDRMFRLRDYRPHALRLFLQGDVIRTTEDGRLYLSETELERSTLKKFAGIK